MRSPTQTPACLSVQDAAGATEECTTQRLAAERWLLWTPPHRVNTRSCMRSQVCCRLQLSCNALGHSYQQASPPPNPRSPAGEVPDSSLNKRTALLNYLQVQCPPLALGGVVGHRRVNGHDEVAGKVISHGSKDAAALPPSPGSRTHIRGHMNSWPESTAYSRAYAVTASRHQSRAVKQEFAGTATSSTSQYKIDTRCIRVLLQKDSAKWDTVERSARRVGMLTGSRRTFCTAAAVANPSSTYA
jgi:hypothetical protein